MTRASAVAPSPLAPSRAATWRGDALEFLLVGGATLILLPLAWLYERATGADRAIYRVSFLAFYAAHVINDPHFAVTYLLFYRDARARAFGKVFEPAQRARYLVAGLLVPLVLAVWAAVALLRGSAPLLGGMIQLMFLLVGWHYTKQGFGVLAVLSARRGVLYTPLERRVLLAHCFTGWAYAWASPADPGTEFMENGVVYRSLAHPPGLEALTGALLATSTLATLGVLAHKTWRERRLPPLAPLLGLLMSVWLWTVYSGLNPLLVYVIPALHSLQYLYCVALLAKGRARAEEAAPVFAGPAAQRLALLAVSALALGWLLFHGAPSFLDEVVLQRGRHLAEDAAGPLGPTPFLAALATFVNLHHYFMDHVIWRRDNPETRYLRG